MSAARSRSWRWLLAALAATACGCSREASVSGKVTYKDKPVTYGTVIVLGPEHKASSGAIQPDGSYTVEGLVPGEAQFGVVSRDPAKGRTHAKPKGQVEVVEGHSWEPLPRQFELPASSGIARTLKSGPNRQDIDLK